MSLFKRRTSFEASLARDVVKENVTGTQCMTCLKSVDSEAIVEGGPGSGKTWALILAKCHGAEQTERIDLGTTEWTKPELKFALQKCSWFDPTHVAGVEESS